MQDAPPIAPGLHAPPGEPLPMVVWLASGEAGLVARLRQLGAHVAIVADAEGPRPVAAGAPAGAAAPADADAWPAAVAAGVAECRRRFARAYVIRRRDSPGGARVAAGLAATPAHDADPWSVALLAGAARDAGLVAEVDRARPGEGASDDLQGIDLALPSDAGDALVAIVGALADGLRIAQLKC